MITKSTFVFIVGGFFALLSPPAVAIPILSDVKAGDIKVAASSQFGPRQSAGNLISGTGLSVDDKHDSNKKGYTMWYTGTAPAASAYAPGFAPSAGWVRFDFNQPEPLAEIEIWNHNQAGFTERGFRKTRIIGTSDGTHWFALTAPEVVELPRAVGDDAEGATVISLAQNLAPVKSVIVAAESNYGGDAYGLSAVRFLIHRDVAEADLPFPSGLEGVPTHAYRHLPDGKPGREVTINFKGAKLYPAAELDVAVAGQHEITPVPAAPIGTTSASVLLPTGISVKEDAPVTVTLRCGKKTLQQSFVVPKERYWTVYILPHSHVDLGFTNTQANVLIVHTRDLIYGNDLAKKTANYPVDARYIWNNEVAWPVERYLSTATPEQKQDIIDGFEKGRLQVGAGYLNEFTTAFIDEGSFSFLQWTRQFEQVTNTKIDTLSQTDVPGISWGVVPVAAQDGVRYVMMLFNGWDRVGPSLGMSFHPFWWIGPDGKSKVLLLQPGDYTPGAKAKGHLYARGVLDNPDPSTFPMIVKTDHPRANFIDDYLFKTLTVLDHADYYPYDIFPMVWSMADNVPIDADLPDAVKSWNEDYAYPHLIIASEHEIMKTFDDKYGAQLPSYKGDITECWTDTLGSMATWTSMSRTASERLIQSDTLWSMLHSGTPAPRADFDEAWRNVHMGIEHTWGLNKPELPMAREVEQTKGSYFQAAVDLSQKLLSDALTPVAAPASSTIAVFNTLSWPHSGLVTLTADQSKAGDRVTTDAGKEVPSQRLSTGELVFWADNVPAFGGKSYQVQAGAGSLPGDCKCTGNTIANSLVSATVDPATGNIVSLTKAGQSYNYADPSADGGLDTYHWLQLHDDPAANKIETDSNPQITVKENGPLVAEYEIDSTAPGCKSLARSVRLVAGSPSVEITDVLDKLPLALRESIHVGFGFKISNPKIHVDIPWGVMRLDTDQLPWANRNWICLQRWLDISNDERGVTWCPIDAPLFESGAITATILGKALGSPQWLTHLNPSATVYSFVLNNDWLYNCPQNQEGKITFRYRILPHDTAYSAAAANRFGLEQTEPLIAAPAKGNGPAQALVSADNPRVVITILKTSADGKYMVFRLRSLSDKAESVKLNWPAGEPKSLHAGLPNDVAGPVVTGDVAMDPLGLKTLVAEMPWGAR